MKDKIPEIEPLKKSLFKGSSNFGVTISCSSNGFTEADYKIAEIINIVNQLIRERNER